MNREAGEGGETVEERIAMVSQQGLILGCTPHFTHQ